MKVMIAQDMLRFLLDLDESVTVDTVTSEDGIVKMDISDPKDTLGVPEEFKDQEFVLKYEYSEDLGIVALDTIALASPHVASS